MPNVLRNLPSVGELLESPPLKALIDRLNRNVVVTGVRHFLDDMQSQIRTAAAPYVPAPTELALRIAEWIGGDRRPTILPVINATGIVLHSRLGGAPLADEAMAEIAALTHGYASVGMDLSTGDDAEETSAIEQLLVRLTGAEAATIASSLSGAALVALASAAANKEVIVARGQVTAIDQGYRLPELCASCQVALREAGTANVTQIDDYAAAISPQTAAILHHPACGFAMVGTAASASLSEIVALARQHRLLTIECLEEASLIDLTPYGITAVPVVSASLNAGADLVLMSGDGFAGGPACGIILGTRSLVQKIKDHPLRRAVRANKLTLAALAATLRLYEDRQLAERAIPTLSLLATPLENLRQRAERLAPQIAATGLATVDILTTTGFVAGHEVPGQSLPTVVLALTPKLGTAEQLASTLRLGTPAVVGRVSDSRLILDLRSIMPRDDLPLITAITAQQPVTPQPSADQQITIAM